VTAKHDDPRLRPLLQQGLLAQPVALPAPAIDALLCYISELSRWNQAYNLTAVRDPRDMIERHLLDSLAVVPFLQGDTVLDVGAGAGLPGVPLAIAYPQRQFCLLDSNGKKTRFMQHVVRVLGLQNVDVVQARIEQFTPEQVFSAVISRAFSALANYVQSVHHVLAPGGVIYAMKGALDDHELRQLPTGFRIRATRALSIAGLADAQRHLLEVEALP
jgi:16S rRNA (guanine527-N7)-methyltransferase